MTNPFLALTKLVSSVSEASTQFMAPVFKPAGAPVIMPGRAIALYPITEGGEGRHVNRQTRFVYGRVRWAAPHMILEWHTKQGTSKENFAIYRGWTMAWREARLLDLSIFTTINSQTNLVTYRAVDTTAQPPGPYYYWIVNLRAKDGEERLGPYRGAIENTPEG